MAEPPEPKNDSPSDDLPPAPGDDRFRLLVESVRDYAIFLLDTEGRVASWNRGAERIKGYTAKEIIGQHFSRFYPRETAAAGWPQRELEFAREQGRFEEESWRVRNDGSRFWANVVITALRDPTGTLLGYAKITRDLTERRRNEESLRHSEEQFRLLVEGVKDYAIFFVDLDGRISSWNAGAQRIKGYSHHEIIGRPFSTFFTAEDVAAGRPELAIGTARARGRFEDKGWRVRKDGTRFWARTVLTALHDQAGVLRGYAKVTRDLTERQRIESLELTRRRMNEFMAMLAHELRNPLAPIRNALSVMSETPEEDPDVSECRGVIERQVALLSRLVDDLLDVSRVSTGKLKLRREAIDARDVVSRAVEAARPLLGERQHAIDVRMPPEPVTIDGDPTRLVQVLLNLVNNAAKYTPSGGHVVVTLTADDVSAVIRVRDDGMGIAAEFLPRVFDLFIQGSRAVDRSDGGLGIGLTLVRWLTELHGGSVEASSEGPGKGSEFTVRLPRRHTGDTASVETAPSEAPSARRATGLRVLVVDDNRDSAETMAMLLRAWGHEVRTAHDGPSALELAPAFRPAVVLLDIGLPGMNGYEVADRIRALPGVRVPELIAMTGYGQESDRRRTTEAGFAHHLVKPIEGATLRTMLGAIPRDADA